VRADLDREYGPTPPSVAAVAAVSVAAFADSGNATRDRHTLPDGETVESRLPVNDHTVWALTGHVTSTLLRDATDRRPPASLKTPTESATDSPTDTDVLPLSTRESGV
jgi:hypothetical protein